MNGQHQGKLGNTNQAIEDPAQRPIGQPLPVRQALRNGDRRARLDRGEAVEELLKEPRLADAGRCNHADHEGTQLVERPARDQLQLLQVRAATDQGRPRRHREEGRPPQ